MTDTNELKTDVSIDFGESEMSDIAEDVIRQKYTEASGKNEWTKSVPSGVSPFGDGAAELTTEITDAPNIPDDAMIQRVVVDVKNGITAWYTEDN